MLEFAAHPDCQKCALYELSQKPGIATRMPDFQTAPEHTRALLVVGQNPGATEDSEGISWRGQSGRLLHRILTDVVEIQKYADVYLTNAARCRTPDNKNPGKSHCKKCWPYLRADLDTLVAHYGAANITLLCMGAPAAGVVLDEAIRRAVISNGATRKLAHWPDGPAFPVFATYHPSATLPGRDPSLLQPMSDHMNLLREHFSGDYTPPTLPKTIFTAPVKLPPYVDLVALDIETYGILEDTEQTVFHPARMTAVDSVPRHKIVVCAALSWWTEDHSEIHSATFRWSDDTHRAAFYSCLNNLPPKATLCGMNLPFDLSVLRYVDPRLAMLIRIDRYTLDDLSIWNQLDSDVRPEHSLKALSTLFRKMDYEHMQVNAKAGAKAKSDTDANLILYNCADTEATLRGRQTCIENIIRQHGTEHPAFTPYMTEFRSDLLWITLHHTEAGAMFDRTALERLETKCARKATRLADRLYARNVIPCGKGSEKSIRAAVYTAMCDAGLIRAAADTGKVWIDPRVKLTDAAKELGTGKANIHLLLAVMPRFAKSRATIRLIEAHRHASKIIDTYTSVLLREPARGCDARGMAWASWFPVPGHAKDTSDSEGGTKQGRFAAKNPAIQTLPPPVQKCMVSRYGRDGILAAYDESQGELRQATLLSGDEAFMEAYENDIDNHVETARETWPELVAGMRDYDKKRQAGKRTNFLALYLGGPARLIEAMRADVGWEMTLPQAADIVHGFDRKHRTFRRWQHAMIDDVALKGFLLLPTGWKRTFLGGPEVAQMSYTNEIANCPVQTLFAQCVESAQAMILRDRAKHRWTFMMSAQIHDAIYIDCHKNCFAEVDACVRHWLAHPPLWEYLEAYYGRHVKLKVDCKIKYDGSKQ